jgi:hypothetical protein
MSVDEKFHNLLVDGQKDIYNPLLHGWKFITILLLHTHVLPSHRIGLYTELAHKEEEELPFKMVPKKDTKTSSTWHPQSWKGGGGGFKIPHWFGCLDWDIVWLKGCSISIAQEDILGEDFRNFF